MRHRLTYLSYFFLFFTLSTWCTTRISFAQQTTELGVYLENLPQASEISQMLKNYDALGITFLEIEHPVTPVILDSISAYSFSVLIRFNKKFLTTEEVKHNQEQLLEYYQNLVLEYAEFEHVVAYGLYSFSQSFDSEFDEKFSFIEDELRKSTNREFYEVTSGVHNELDFSITQFEKDSIPKSSQSVLFKKKFTENDLYQIKDIISGNPVFFLFEANWLNEALVEYPPFRESLIDFKSSKNLLLPLPNKQEPAPGFNWPVLVLVLIWISLGIHIQISGTYGPLIFRYFNGHRFFADDVMRYRERSFLSGTFLVFQHAAFTGLVTYILSALLISPKGLEALFYYLPQITIFGQNYFTLFVLGTLISLLVQFIGLMWLYLPSKSMTHFSQALNLYSWIFHIDFILVSVMLVLFLADGSSTLIIILAILFTLNWLIGFLLTSFDSSKYLIKKRASYILYTFGLHTLVNIFLLVLVLSNNYLIDVLELLFVL